VFGHRIRIGAPAAGPAAAAAERPALLLPEKPSLAVLAFQNMSGDPEQEYFGDGDAPTAFRGHARVDSLLS